MNTNYYLVDDDDSRIHLAKIAVGWEPQIQWHDGNCSCNCERHHYRNIDEFRAFVRDSQAVVQTEIGEEIPFAEFISRLERAKKENELTPESSKASTWCIEGWWFVKGNWV